MLNSIPCGDFELNLAHPTGMPTLVPSPALERRLDWRLPRMSQINLEHASAPIKGKQGSPDTLPPLTVHLHIHYLETLPTLLKALERCKDGLDDLRLWISTDSSCKAELINNILQDSFLFTSNKKIQVRVCPNRGRNLGPLLLDLWPDLKDQALILHLHSKRSVESNLGEAWLNQLLKNLLPDSETVQALRRQFQQDSKLGLVIPQPPELIRPYLNWGNNFELAERLAEPLGHRLHRDAVLIFPAGGMFWMKPAAISPLVDCMNTMSDLPPEPLPVDGSSLHALERLAAHACEASGHHWKLACGNTTITSNSPATLSVLTPLTDIFQQATSALASHFRQQSEEMECSSINLNRCTKQLKSADAQLESASTTIQHLEKTILAIEELNARMTSSKTWRLSRLLKRLMRAET